MTQSAGDRHGQRDPWGGGGGDEDEVVAGDHVVTSEVTKGNEASTDAEVEGSVFWYAELVGELPAETGERRGDGARRERPNAVRLDELELGSDRAEPGAGDGPVVQDVLVEQDLGVFQGQVGSSSPALAITNVRSSRIGTKVGQRASAAASCASSMAANDFAAAS